MFETEFRDLLNVAQTTARELANHRRPSESSPVGVSGWVLNRFSQSDEVFWGGGYPTEYKEVNEELWLTTSGELVLVMVTICAGHDTPKVEPFTPSRARDYDGPSEWSTWKERRGPANAEIGYRSFDKPSQSTPLFVTVSSKLASLQEGTLVV